MATAVKQPPLSPRIRALLRGLRWRIRLYTLLQGLALLACWVCLMFWVVLFFDYVPMRFGATELPVAVRAGLLIFVGVGAAFILYRWVLRRTFAHLADHSMAVLLERRHERFHDSLLTAVELNEHPDHASQFNPEMLEHTGAEALAHSSDVRLRRVFRWAPLVLSVLAAVMLLGSVGAFAAIDFHGDTFEQAVSRIYLMDERPWERLAYLEVVGVTRYTIVHENADPRDLPASEDNRPKLKEVIVPFSTERTVTVAAAANPRLHVRAEVIEHERPSGVTVWWTNADGWGRHEMTSSSQSEDGFLNFSLARGPFNGIRWDLEFDARGYDFRTPKHTIHVVEGPEISNVEVTYDRPLYLVDEDRSIFQTVPPMPLTVGAQVPRGSRVTLIATANKPLERVYVYDPATRETTVIEPGQSGPHKMVEVEVEVADEGAGENGDTKEKRTELQYQIHYVIDKFDRDYALEWMLVDEDGLVTETPHPTGLTVRDDQLPSVDVAVRGIGTAVTPDVRFPVAGRAADDYWLERAWLEVQVGSETPHRLALPIARGGFDEEQIAEFGVAEDDNVFQWIDMRDERNLEENFLALQPGDKVTLAAVGADRYDLDGFDLESNPHIGVGPRFQVEVVTANELIAILERRELELRRRLEQKVEELTQMRDSLVRVKDEVINSDASAAEDGSDDGGESGEEEVAQESDSAEPGDTKLSPEEAARRQVALRRLRVQQAVNQSETARGELKDVVRALLLVVDQLENNRVDREDRKERLRSEVAAPLAKLVEEDFPELDKRLASLNGLVAAQELDVAKTSVAADHSIAQTEDVLLKLDGVLQKMLDMETFNELIELVRALIDDQDDLIKETKVVRKNQVFGLE